MNLLPPRRVMPLLLLRGRPRNILLCTAFDTVAQSKMLSHTYLCTFAAFSIWASGPSGNVVCIQAGEDAHSLHGNHPDARVSLLRPAHAHALHDVCHVASTNLDWLAHICDLVAYFRLGKH